MQCYMQEVPQLTKSPEQSPFAAEVKCLLEDALLAWPYGEDLQAQQDLSIIPATEKTEAGGWQVPNLPRLQS